jgi:MinD-like ATPase involved in chromosome partitioning or flagellar assembly
VSGLEGTDAARDRGAGTGGSRPGNGSPAGDGWVAGAWSTEGGLPATHTEPAPPVEDPQPAEAGTGPAAGTQDRAVDPVPEAARSATGVAAPSAAGPEEGPARPAVAPPVPAPPPPEPLAPPVPAVAPVRAELAAARPPSSRPRPRVDAASAAELTEDAIVRFRSDRPAHGWRAALFRATGGVLNPGIGPAERTRQEQLRRIRRPLPGSHRIAVSSIKGGVGKTTVSACLGLVLAENRGDRVVALDANPDAGTLADRLTGDTSLTVRSLLDHIGATHSLTDVARYTSLAGRLQVLASEQDPAVSEAFDRDEYERVCAVLTRFYNIVITDSGTGLVHSAMEGTLALADSLVVVGSPTVDGASRASKTLDWMIAHGHAARVVDAVVVLSCDRVGREVDRGRVRDHFEARCRAVVEVPHDPHLATGGRVELARLKPATHDAFLVLAAHLADGFVSSPRPADARPGPVPSLG